MYAQEEVVNNIHTRTHTRTHAHKHTRALARSRAHTQPRTSLTKASGSGLQRFQKAGAKVRANLLDDLSYQPQPWSQTVPVAGGWSTEMDILVPALSNVVGERPTTKASDTNLTGSGLQRFRKASANIGASLHVRPLSKHRAPTAPAEGGEITDKRNANPDSYQGGRENDGLDAEVILAATRARIEYHRRLGKKLRIHLGLGGVGLSNSDGNVLSSSSLVVSDASGVLYHRTENVQDDPNPTFKPFALDFDDLCAALTPR